MSVKSNGRKTRHFYTTKIESTLKPKRKTNFEKKAFVSLFAIIIDTALVTFGILNKHYSIIIMGLVIMVFLLLSFAWSLRYS